MHLVVLVHAITLMALVVPFVSAVTVGRTCRLESFTGRSCSPPCRERNHYLDLACFCTPCPREILSDPNNCLVILGLCPPDNTRQAPNELNSGTIRHTIGPGTGQKPLETLENSGSISTGAIAAISMTAVAVVIVVVVVGLFLSRTQEEEVRSNLRVNDNGEAANLTQQDDTVFSDTVVDDNTVNASSSSTGGSNVSADEVDAMDPTGRSPQRRPIIVHDNVHEGDNNQFNTV